MATLSPCKDKRIYCPKQIRFNDQGMEQVLCCDNECTNVGVKRR